MSGPARLTRVHELLERTLGYPAWVMTLLVVSAVVALPIRLYLTSAVVFELSGLSNKFHRLFPVTFPLDQLWALSPFFWLPRSEWAWRWLQLLHSSTLLSHSGPCF